MVLLREARSGRFRRTAMRALREFADRLEAHIRKRVNPAKGDTLLLIDLAYDGRAN